MNKQIAKYRKLKISILKNGSNFFFVHLLKFLSFIIAHNDQGVPTFAMARVCSCKRSDRSKCGEAQARVA
ncbi:TraY domain-containing protein [Leptospira selangorensis]|nr:TraY domain-containing protein [Leptospira selangorensis]